MEHRITGLAVQKKNPQRVNVELDGEFAFGLERITAAWLKVGQTLTDGEIEKLRGKDEQERVYLSAYRLLAVRARSGFEIRQRLLQKGFPADAVRAVVERLEANGLLDDPRFARDWVEDRTALHPRSHRLMAWELRQKGIHPEVIGQALHLADEDEKLAWTAARGWLAKHGGGLDQQQFRRRLGGFLSRRGFRYETIRNVVSGLWEEMEEEKRSFSLSNPLK